jgi:chromate reductase, NAD(P)H dehydrogenase (quinone)
MKKIGLFFLLALLHTMALSAQVKVLAFAGSTRADSYNKKLLREAAEIGRKMGAQVTVIDLKDYPMPLYDADDEISKGMPESAKRLRAQMIESDAILIASPEYNSSIPAVLKNTLDWASRSEKGGSARGDIFKGKKTAIISASPGKGGGKRALVHLRAIIEDIGGKVITEEVSISVAHEYFSQSPKSENPALKEVVEKLTRTSEG